MSRTYRKFAVVKDNKRHSKKYARQEANRRIRRTSLDEVSNGCHYKKFYEQWDICDHKSYCTLNEWLDRWSEWYHSDDLYKNHPRYLAPTNWYGVTIQDAIRNWKKMYFWK